MFMKYFEYIFFLFPVGFVVFFATILFLRLRCKHLQNLAKINILKRQQSFTYSVFFASEVIERSVFYLFISHQKSAKQALAYLAAGRTEKAATLLEKKHPLTAALLRAHSDTTAIYKEITKNKKTWLNSPKYAPYVQLLAYLCLDTKTAFHLPEKVNFKKLCADARAVYCYISAFIYMQDADMMSASKAATQALDFYKKKHRPIEEARCYLLLGEIYRISCVNDIAQTMIESALKIYKERKLPLLQVHAITALGMLMLFEGRAEEAENRFTEALNLTPPEITKAEILNQFVLLKIAENDYKTATKIVRQALSIHTKLKNPRGQALSLQLSAHLQTKQNHYKTAVKEAEQAAALYLKQKNYSAYAESLYISADARCKMKQYALAEQALRSILDNNLKHPNSFHTANAYSLLGLIYLQRGDKQRAKVLIQQSLHLEQSCERCQGLAADYANLALIGNLSGDTFATQSHLEIALEYATKSGDEGLIQLIKDKTSALYNK